MGIHRLTNPLLVSCAADHGQTFDSDVRYWAMELFVIKKELGDLPGI